MGLRQNRFLSFREAYDAYCKRVTVPCTEGAVRRWLNTGKVPGIKRGSKWQLQVQDLVRYHANHIGTGKGKKGTTRRERVKPVSKFQLDPADWAPHVEKFLKGRKVVRPRQILDLVGVPQDKLAPEVGSLIAKVKEQLRALGWEQLPPPHSYDWAPLAEVKKAKREKKRPPRANRKIEQDRRELLRFLRKGGLHTMSELATRLGLSKSQTRLMLTDLVHNGQVLTLGQASQTMYYHP